MRTLSDFARGWARKPTNIKPGFTLIELLLYSAIIGGLLLSITMFFNLSLESRTKGQTINNVNYQAGLVMDTITQAIRNSNSITFPSTGTSNLILVLNTPIVADNPIFIGLVTNSIQIKKGAGAAAPLHTADVIASGVVFKNLGNNTVQISFTLTHTNAGGRNEYEYTQTYVSSAKVGW